MSYSKTNWTNNSTPAINADNLNKIEQGIYDNDAAIASANTNIGTLTNLTTTEKSNLVGAINEVDSNTDINTTNIGDLSDLETTVNTDLVSAINENVSSIGDLSDLETTANTDLVSAINEVDGNTDINTAKLNGTQVAGDMVVDSIKTKNLCNISSSGMFPNTSGTVTVGNCYSAVIDVSNMSSVYVSGNFNLLGDTLLRIGEYSSYPKQGSTGTRMSMSSSGAIDVSNVNYLLFAFVPASSATLDQIKNSFMIEEGTSATTFKPCQDLDAVSNNYSTLETKIGTWIDGKPLYRKVIDYFPTGTIGQISAITDILVPHNVSNIKQVVDCKMVSDSSSGSGIFPHIGTSNGQFLNRGTSIVSFDTTKLRLRIINDTWSSSHFYITIEYTKTTD